MQQVPRFYEVIMHSWGRGVRHRRAGCKRKEEGKSLQSSARGRVKGSFFRVRKT